ncbi:hypothetical protein AALO_G00023300 [Alosa alosa]|uniref:CWF21 domain-containing protein n=1 Tax=Alosa alosa TaxID=278164 RepID=A0AAV6HD59_9TELE|nr:hypothetical protein AALO_G00023300 [Alosa alosa]
MELQEMMEEQGYSEEEVRQKVGTFRQMLMEKEGVITREGSHAQPPVGLLPHSDEEHLGDTALADGYEECDWHGDYYDGDYRTKRKSSSSPSPRPKKRKKKKSGRKRSREKRKKSSRKHKRDRSTSGSKRKRRYRSGSPKNKHKDKNKQRKRSPADSPSRRSHRRGSCSSRSASLSSTGSFVKSPSRLSVKQWTGGHRSSRSPSPPVTAENPTTWQNGHHSDRARNGKELVYNHVDGEKVQDVCSLLSSAPPHPSTPPHPSA